MTDLLRARLPLLHNDWAGGAASTGSLWCREPRKELGRSELTAFLAWSMALATLGIDLMLPAFGDMREHSGLAEGSTAIAGLVTAYFFGLIEPTLRSFAWVSCPNWCSLVVG